MRPRLGGLGEVAVPPTFRRRGVATRLSALVRDEFRERGGSVLYLGTVNPQAERVYRRLGWRRLAATCIMAWPAGPQSPEEFLVDAYRDDPGGETRWRIERLTPAARLPVIPLITTPHDWPVLDASTGVCSNRYHELKRCMSLYPLFEQIDRMPGGACFAAWADTGHLVGLATARPLDGRALQVDGFTHGRFSDALIPLLERCFDHASSADRDCQVLVSVEDFERRALFEAQGFEVDGPTVVQLDGHLEPGHRLIRRSIDARGLPVPKTLSGIGDTQLPPIVGSDHNWDHFSGLTETRCCGWCGAPSLDLRVADYRDFKLKLGADVASGWVVRQAAVGHPEIESVSS